MTLEFDNVQNVSITQARWSIKIELTLVDGETKVYYASADSALTWRDGIWFGSQDEYKEAFKQL